MHPVVAARRLHARLRGRAVADEAEPQALQIDAVVTDVEPRAIARRARQVELDGARGEKGARFLDVAAVQDGPAVEQRLHPRSLAVTALAGLRPRDSCAFRI